MKHDFVDLFEFQTRMKEGIECLFPTRFWLRAEISAVKARPGGHCYLELSQSNEDGLVAKASAAIWSSKYRFIAPYFESVTGSPVSEGMTVLIKVQATYSQLYGFTLIVDDIDPEYSLGQKEMERRKTIARLEAEGLMDLQKGLSLPLLPYRFAVVSAEDAAGYRDFMKHLHGNAYAFSFETDLFPALMQGAGCPESIVSALDSVLESGKEYDAVLILRGGGSKLDLSCYDDYGLASVIAQYPLPVMTAVGHDQDFHVCDMVAHTYVKTPTALADEIVCIYEDEDARIASFASRMKAAFSGRVSDASGALALLHSRIRSALLLKISGMEAAVEVLKARIGAANPEKVLERGYALAVGPDGTVMKGVASVVPGDAVEVMFADGVLGCRVEKVERKI